MHLSDHKVMLLAVFNSGPDPPKPPGNGGPRPTRYLRTATRRVSKVTSPAELKGPRKLLRIRPEIFDLEPDLSLKLGQAKPKISGTVPTDGHTTIPNDSGPISSCFDDDPKLWKNCGIAQPNSGACWRCAVYDSCPLPPSNETPLLI